MAARQTLNAHQVKLVRTEGVLTHAQQTSLVVKQLFVQSKVIEQVVLVLQVLKDQEELHVLRSGSDVQLTVSVAPN